MAQRQQQAQQAAPPQPIPADVQIVASTNQLGIPRTDFKAKLARLPFLNTRNIIILTLAAILGGAGLIAYGLLVRGSAAPLEIIGLVILCFGLWFFINVLLYYGLRVYVYTEGLVRLKGDKSDVVRWDQIKTIWQKVNKRYIGTFHIGTTHVYTVERNDGKKFTFNDGLSNVEGLGNILTREVDSRLLPEVIAKYDAGEQVVFGKLKVSIHGISNGEDIVLWNQIQGIQVMKGALAINKDGQWLNWPSIKVAKTPNFPVFMALVDYIMKSR